MSEQGEQLFNLALEISRAQHPLCLCAGFRRNNDCPKHGDPVEDKRPGQGVYVNTECDE